MVAGPARSWRRRRKRRSCARSLQRALPRQPRPRRWPRPLATAQSRWPRCARTRPPRGWRPRQRARRRARAAAARAMRWRTRPRTSASRWTPSWAPARWCRCRAAACAWLPRRTACPPAAGWRRASWHAPALASRPPGRPGGDFGARCPCIGLSLHRAADRAPQRGTFTYAGQRAWGRRPTGCPECVLRCTRGPQRQSCARAGRPRRRSRAPIPAGAAGGGV